MRVFAFHNTHSLLKIHIMTGIFDNHQITHRCHLLLYSNVLVIQFQYNTHHTKRQCFLCIVYITYILFLRILETLHNRLLDRTKGSAKIVHFFKKLPRPKSGEFGHIQCWIGSGKPIMRILLQPAEHDRPMRPSPLQ